MTTLKQPELNGCHNRAPLKQTLQVQDGWTEDGRRVMKENPFAMSTDCRHDKRATDPRCAGCRWIDPAGDATTTGQLQADTAIAVPARTSSLHQCGLN